MDDAELARLHETLFAQRWKPLPPATAEPAEWAVAGPASLVTELDAPAFVLDDLTTLADLVTSWLAEHFGIRLILLTHGAVHAGGYTPDPTRAATWGLGRAQQLRHPGRLILVDADEVTEETLSAAVSSGEDQLALRASSLLRPIYAPVPTNSAGPRLSGTVILTGDDPPLAHHLMTAHDVRQVVPDAAALKKGRADGVVGVNLTAQEMLILHETTLVHNLSAFILLNSGTDAYACAVADALARHRHTLELPALSVTWTHEEFTPLPESRRIPMIDAALATAEPCVIAGLRDTDAYQHNH